MEASKHPIVAVTGASGAGTTVVQQAFKELSVKANLFKVLGSYPVAVL